MAIWSGLVETVVSKSIVGVVENPAAGADKRDPRDRCGRHRAAPETLACDAQPLACAIDLPPYPQDVDCHGEQPAEEDPVERVPEEGLDEVPVPVHVGVRRARHETELVEIVVEVEGAERRCADDEDQHQQIAQVAIVRQHLAKDRQHRREQKRRPRQQEHAAQIETGLEVRVATEELDAHACEHRHEQQRGDDQKERRQLRPPEHPVRRR